MSIDSSFRKPEADLATQATGIGALADPVRRALYQYVVAQPDAVGREAAAAVHVPVHTAKFHLDRLCDEGLLQAEYRLLPGRVSGPRRTCHRHPVASVTVAGTASTASSYPGQNG